MEVFLIVILSFFVLGYILRLLAPYILKWYVKRMQKRFGFSQQGQQYAKKEGEVSINNASSAHNKKKKAVAKDVGDYIDFEEVS